MFFRQGVLATRLGLVAGLAALLFAGCGSDDDGRALGPDSGQVRAEVTVDGQPFPGVTVTLNDGGQFSQTTGADGTANFENLANGTYTVSISGFDANRFLFTRTSVPVTLDDTVGQVTVQFQGATVPTGRVTGQVTFNGLTPARLPGDTITVTLVPPTGSPVTGDLTGTSGEFTFGQLGVGTFTLRVARNGQVRQTTFALAQGEQLTLDLEFSQLPDAGTLPPGTPTGQVRAEVTAAGQPVVGATVTLTNGVQLTQTTGQDGVAVFDNVPNGTFTVTLAAFDASRFSFTTTTASVTLNDQIGQATVQFQGLLASTGALSGRVTFNGQAPAQIPNETVTITLVPPVGSAVTGDLTGTTGEYQFSPLQPGTFTVRVARGTELRQTTVTLGQGEQRVLDLEFSQMQPVP